MTEYFCDTCHYKFPDKIITNCENCGGTFTNINIRYDAKRQNNSLPGIWKYKETFGLPSNAPVVSLGEGNTPLVNLSKTNIWFKSEHQNPTGSFKDRLVSPIVGFLKHFDVDEAVEDSSGNAGASFAAYASSVGIRAKVFVPAFASGPKRVQIERFGAELISVEGSRYDTTLAIQKYIKDNNMVYASHAHIPHGVAGIATIAYEIFDQLNGIPDYVVCPIGHGSLMAGIALGFSALKNAGDTQKIPMVIGVQSENFAPIKNLAENNKDSPLIKTLAEGASVLKPVFMVWLINNQERHNLMFTNIKENQILKSRDELAKMGFYVEETSAIIWPVIKNIAERKNQLQIVGILTGAGLKSSY
jgi:threonine synthase